MKRKFSIAGMVICAVILVLGLMVIGGVLGGTTSYAVGSYLYDSGYASFGADFYTYVNNNAQEAASAARTTANNLNAIAELLKWSFGLLLCAMGAIGICGFGVVYSGCEKKASRKPAAAAAPKAVDTAAVSVGENKEDSAPEAAEV